MLGSSLVVHPAAAIPMAAAEAGVQLIIANREPTPLDGLAAVVLRDPLEEVLPALEAPVSALLDARGCLTEAGLPPSTPRRPGRGRPMPRRTWRACAHCQRRFLARGGTDVAGIRAVPRQGRGPAAVAHGARGVALLVLVLIAVVGIRLLTAPLAVSARPRECRPRSPAPTRARAGRR